MEEEYGKFLEWTKSALSQAIQYFEVWLGRIQTDEHLQNVMLGFLVGSAFGWFLSSLLSKKRNPILGKKIVLVALFERQKVDPRRRSN
jgi:hypothetical protein